MKCLADPWFHPDIVLRDKVLYTSTILTIHCSTDSLLLQEGKTPLHLAEGNEEIMGILIETRKEQDETRKGQKSLLPWKKSALVRLECVSVL